MPVYMVFDELSRIYKNKDNVTYIYLLLGIQ